jgi:hypothetical protein
VRSSHLHPCLVDTEALAKLPATSGSNWPALNAEKADISGGNVNHSRRPGCGRQVCAAPLLLAAGNWAFEADPELSSTAPTRPTILDHCVVEMRAQQLANKQLDAGPES